MTGSLISFLRQLVVLVDGDPCSLTSNRRVAAKARVSYDEIDFTLKADNVVLIEVLKSCLAIIVELPEGLIVHHTLTSSETFQRFRMARLHVGSAKKSSSTTDYNAL